MSTLCIQNIFCVFSQLNHILTIKVPLSQICVYCNLAVFQNMVLTLMSERTRSSDMQCRVGWQRISSKHGPDIDV
jgi:hypothetical protein